MYRTRHVHTKQLIALLLMTVMLLVHVSKALHTHTAYSKDHSCQLENTLTKAGGKHSPCSICEFQLAKDAPFTGEIELIIAPVHIAPTYSRLLTSINPDHSFLTGSRGPPRA